MSCNWFSTIQKKEKRMKRVTLLVALLCLCCGLLRAGAQARFAIQDLGMGEGLAINADGQVTGYMVRPDGSAHAFIWSQHAGTLDLGTLGGDSSYGVGINAQGEVT